MNKFKVKTKHNSCRACNSKNNNLHHFFHVTDLPMPEGHISEEENEYVHDIDIFWCEKCGMVQTQLDLDLDKYYENYIYTTGESNYVEEYMQNFAKTLCDKYKFSKGSVIVEAGSGDGVQLRKFKELGCSVIGVEPSYKLSLKAEKIGIPTIVDFFETDVANQIKNKYESVDAVIIQYTFDHLQKPSEFVADVYNLLGNNGILVIEVHDFEKIYERNEACLFTHEHSIYPTFSSISNLLDIHNMKIIDTNVVVERERRGNSIVIVAAKKIHTGLEVDEPDSIILQKLKEHASYNLFSKNVYKAHEKLHSYALEKKRNKIKIAGYGAAGRGVDTTVLAKLNNNMLDCVYDMNKGFHGKKMPVSHLEVKNPNELFSDNPEELIVFSYGYIDEIRELYKDHPVRVISMLDIMNSL